MTAKEIREKRAALAKEIRKMADLINSEGRDFTPEEQALWEKINGDYDALEKPLQVAERADKVDAEIESRVADENVGRGDYNGNEERNRHTGRSEQITDADVAGAIRAWALSHSSPGDVREVDLESAKRMGIHPGSRSIRMPLSSGDSFHRMQSLYRSRSSRRAFDECRALSAQQGQSLGFTIAPNFNAGIESAMLYYGPMLQVAEIIRTSTGADLPFMTDNETTKTGSYVGENTAITTAEDIDTALTVMKSFKATTNAILVPYELLRDTSINLNAYISSKLGERLGRFLNTQATTGAVKARGIVTRATTGKTTASSTAIAFDEIYDLKHSVDRSYRTGASWMFHDSICLAIRKLKDGSGNYLWSNGTQAGEPDRLDGDPIFINNDMASSIATTNTTMLYGQFERFKIRLIQELRLTMTDQRYWEYDQTAFAAYMDFDTDLIDAGTNPVKKMVQV